MSYGYNPYGYGPYGPHPHRVGAIIDGPTGGPSHAVVDALTSLDPRSLLTGPNIIGPPDPRLTPADPYPPYPGLPYGTSMGPLPGQPGGPPILLDPSGWAALGGPANCCADHEQKIAELTWWLTQLYAELQSVWTHLNNPVNADRPFSG